MRYTKLMFLLLGFAATLCAADSFVGTWKMNPAKTKYKAGKAAKEQTINITETGADMAVKVTGTAADGSKISISYTLPSAGGTGKFIEAGPYDGVTSKRLGLNEREVTFMKGGKPVYTAHSKIAPDGKSLTVAGKGQSPAGQTVDGTAFYDKLQ